MTAACMCLIVSERLVLLWRCSRKFKSGLCECDPEVNKNEGRIRKIRYQVAV